VRRPQYPAAANTAVRSALSKAGIEPADVHSTRASGKPIRTVVTLRRPIDRQAAERQLRWRVGKGGSVQVSGLDVIVVTWPTG
jgi:tRNA U54 and U55 pseudouridine synthase Pus10